MSLLRVAVLVLLAVALVACARGGEPGRPRTPTATPTPTPTAVVVSGPSGPNGPTGFRIDFIDVGQGDATLVVAATGESLLIDGGRSRTRIRDRLNALGVTDLDVVLATHPDADHIAGLIEVFSLYEVERFYWNGFVHDTQTFRDLMAAAQAEGSVVTVPRAGDTIALGNLSFDVVHPLTLSGDSNVDSIVLQLRCGAVDVLLTGDAETPSEDDMLASGALVDLDVLKVGHHGSRTSTSDAFLTLVSPEVGVISAGLNNQYGHPHPEVVDLLTAAGVELWFTDTTDQADTVRMVSDCQTYSLEQPPGTTPPSPPTPTPTASTPTPTPTPSIVRAVAPGIVFVTEVMANPVAVSDTAGE